MYLNLVKPMELGFKYLFLSFLILGVNLGPPSWDQRHFGLKLSLYNFITQVQNRQEYLYIIIQTPNFFFFFWEL